MTLTVEARKAAAVVREEKTLNMLVRHNGQLPLISRRTLIERRVASGAVVTLPKNGERVLMSPDGVFLDTRNITAIGLDYAYRLTHTDE